MVAASPARQFLTEAVAERDLAFPGITGPMTVISLLHFSCSDLLFTYFACYALCQLGLRCEQ